MPSNHIVNSKCINIKMLFEKYGFHRKTRNIREKHSLPKAKHSNLNRSASPQTRVRSRQHGPYKDLQSENRQFSFGLSSFPHYKPLLSSLSTYFPFFFSFSMKTHLLLFLRFSFLMRAARSALFLLLTVSALYNYGSFYLLRQRAPTPPPPLPSARVSPCLM